MPTSAKSILFGTNLEGRAVTWDDDFIAALAATIREAIARIPNRRGWLRLWIIFTVLWTGWFIVPALLPLLPQRPATPPQPPSIYQNYIAIDPDTRTYDQQRWDQRMEWLQEAGIVVGVPLSIPMAVIAMAILIGWVQEGFKGS